MDAPFKDIERAGGRLLAEAIDRMRESRVIRTEGYDGEYGVIRLFEESEKATLRGQEVLFDTPAETTMSEEERTPAFSPLPARAVHEEPESYQTFLFDPILDPLNPAQKEAVLHQGSHLLIVAGPGTGKTMTLTHRIAYQIRSRLTSAGEILSLTFTNKAAGEMRKRLAVLLPDEHGAQVTVSTFHAFCLQVLREKGSVLGLPVDFSLLSEIDAAALARQVFSGSKIGVRSVARFLRELPNLKMATLSRAQRSDPLIDLYEQYQQKLRSMKLLDLHDLEVETLRLFQSYPEIGMEFGKRFPKVFVDEYQDTNRIQVEILKCLVSCPTHLPCTLHHEPCTVHLCAIGDPDQAIYGFRGADVENFHRFTDDFPGAKMVTLLVNYRSTQPILDAASFLTQKKQKLKGVLGFGELVQISDCRTEAEEAEMIVELIEKLIGGTSYFSLDSGRASSQAERENLGFGDIAVLFRLNAQGDAFEEAFSRAGIPFVRSGEKPLIQGFPVNVLWRFLQTVSDPENAYYREAYHHVLKDNALTPHLPVNCSSEATLLELIDQAVALHGLTTLSEEAESTLRRLNDLARSSRADLKSFLDVLSLERGIDHAGLLGDRVAVMSLHAAKGLEWPVVFIAGCEDQLLPCTLYGDQDEAEEKRLLYVGMTRARSRLVLSHAARRTLNGRPLDMKPSPFTLLIPQSLRRPLERKPWKPKKKPPNQLSFF